jgi:hypothetical protein
VTRFQEGIGLGLGEFDNLTIADLVEEENDFWDSLEVLKDEGCCCLSSF